MIANLHDIDMSFDDCGQGKPVVLLHGLALDGSIWKEMVNLYEDQARFIVPDLRGHGSTICGDANGSLEQFADDLFELVNYLQVERFTLVGHSMGGYIALSFAEKYADKLDGLVMVTSNARSDSSEKRESRIAEADDAMRSGMTALADSMAHKLTKSTDVMNLVLPILEKTDPKGFANVQRAIASRRNRFTLLKGLEIPLLAVAGSEDQLMKADACFEMAEAAKLGRSVVLPGVGHLPMLEEPLALGALIVSME